MKIKVTEIEATSEDLRANRTLSESLYSALLRAFTSEDDEEEEEESEAAEE